MGSCAFCTIKDGYIADTDYFYVLFDKQPATKGHALIIAKRHVESAFDLTLEEMTALHEMRKTIKEFLDDKFHPDAYNLGVNDGPAAGQSVPHFHEHIMPRYAGDVPNPKGSGVKNVVPRPPENS